MNLIHSPTGMACLIAFFLSLPAMSSMDPFPRALGEAIREAANWRHYCRKLLKGEKGGHGESLPVTKAFLPPFAVVCTSSRCTEIVSPHNDIYNSISLQY